MGKRKPNLPKSVPWPPETVEWFRIWRGSARTDDWDDAQWQYLFDTALVHAQVWGSQDFTAMGELHRRESYMGLAFCGSAPQAKQATTEKANVLSLVVGNRADKAAAAR